MDTTEPSVVPGGAGSGADPLAPLLPRIAVGDEGALRELYDATSPFAHGVALSVLRDDDLAEEALVDVYAQIWSHADRYDPRKGTVLTWIGMLARTRSIDVRRSRARAREFESDVAPETLAAFRHPGADPLERSEAVEAGDRVRGALSALPPEQRRAIEAAFFRGLSYAEVARELAQPLGTVKTRIRAGLAALRRRLPESRGGLA